MGKVKYTKTELKAQRESLKRFERFLPMLQLKKQQLQVEIQQIAARCDEVEAERDAVRAGLGTWQKMLSSVPAEQIDSLVHVDDIRYDEGNIAGVTIPILKDVIIQTGTYDLFETPAWFDDTVEILSKLIRFQAEAKTLREQRRLIEEELRVTTQRVNLFEKVKIPECRENIRFIRIFLGDEQTASVVRGKIAKDRSRRKAEAAQSQ